MNELKRELVKVAGDMSDSEVRVRETVSRRMQKKRRRWVPVISVAVACAMLLLFMQFQKRDTSAMLSHEEYAYYLQFERELWGREIDDYEKTAAFKKLLERVGQIEYGKSLGIVASEAEIAARLEKSASYTALPEYEKMLKERLNEANVSRHVYEQQIVRNQAEALVVRERIGAQLMEKYTLLDESIAIDLVNKYAVDYMEQQYAAEIAVFREQYQIKPESGSPGVVTGIVGLVEGNMFYVIDGVMSLEIAALTREEILTTYFENERGAWYPNVDDLPVQVGDIVRLASGSSHATDNHRVGMNHGGAEIVQSASAPNKTIRLTGTAAAQFTAHIDTLDLAKNIQVSMVRPPDYTVTANGVTYGIWAKYNKSGMEIVRHDPNGYVSIPKSKAAPLYELLQ